METKTCPRVTSCLWCEAWGKWLQILTKLEPQGKSRNSLQFSVCGGDGAYCFSNSFVYFENKRIFYRLQELLMDHHRPKRVMFDPHVYALGTTETVRKQGRKQSL